MDAATNRRRGWIRRHPFLTGILALWTALLVLVVVTDENNRDASTIAGAVVFTLAAVCAALAIAWPIDKWKDRSAGRTAKGAPSAYTAPEPRSPAAPVSQGVGVVAAPPWTTPTPPMPVPPAPRWSTQTTTPHEVSALEETGHVHLPERGPAQPAQYRPVALGDLLAMTPTEFEQLCVRALLNLGYDQVKRTGGAGDLAADIVGRDAQGRSVIVQCKRYAPGSAVGSPVVQTFIGMKAVHHKADRGIIMTTAEFSKPAIELAKQHDIVLIDGDDVVKILNLIGTK